jgi:hypothetical protein
VNESPVRLVISDDLRRGHGSSFFRGWLALPLFAWLALWSIAAFFVAIVNWVATLIRGRSPAPLHSFLSRYVRYATHVYAYLNLAAEPLPNFDGKPGYRIDVEIDPPSSQNRWSVAFRIVLALPALLLVTALVGSGPNINALPSTGFNLGGASLLGAAAVLSWFVAVFTGRVPRGLRDAIAYTLSYGAQFWAYLLLLTDRYPNSDPQVAIGELPSRSDPVGLLVSDDLRRSRLTVFFRLLLVLPHLVWLTLWAICAYVAAIVNWFATLILGASPQALHRFLAAYVRYQSHVYAYLLLIANPFPGFVGRARSYTVEPTIELPRSQNRWTVFFRAVLALPALLLGVAYGGVLLVVALLGWFASLARGRMPQGMRNAGVLALRYSAQLNAYGLLLTDVYPYSGPVVQGGALAAPAPSESPLFG